MPSKLNMYIVNEIRSRFGDVDHCVILTYSGVTSSEMMSLRSAVRKERGRLTVVKNTLATRAFKDIGRDDAFVGMLNGPVALAYGEDPSAVVRALTDWNRKAKKLDLIGGMVGGRAISKAEVARLATLPPLPVMQGMALGAVAAPLTAFLGVCNEVIRSFLRVAEQLAAKQGEAGSAPAGA